MRKTLWISLGFAAAALLVSLAVWSHVPNPMPIHWDASGSADGFAPRAVGLLMSPAIIALLSAFVLWIAGKRVDTDGGKKGLSVIMIATNAFMVGMHVLMIQAAMSSGFALSMGMLMAMLGVLFAVIGGVMPMLPQNKVAGIRTPWTLKSETNWKLTHRFGAWSMGIGGVICVITSLLLSGQAMFWVGFAAVMISSLLPVMYSYMLHRAQNERL
jgi:uncharacterized membrane protein